MRLQVSYKTRVEDFVKFLRKGKGVEYARLNSRVGTRISRAAASLGMSKNGRPSKFLKGLRNEDAAILLINESTRLRVLYEKINHEKTIELNEGLFVNPPQSSAKSKAQRAFDELKTKCQLNKWIRFSGGLKQLAEKHGTSADELKRVGNIKTNGMRGEHARIYIEDVERNGVKEEKTVAQLMREAANKMTLKLPASDSDPSMELTEDKCVAFLKSLGYKLMKPVNEWVEI
jgi:hypothetical protein